MSEFEMKKKLETYVKIELYKIASFVKVGRKYNDKKSDMVQKLTQYFKSGIS